MKWVWLDKDHRSNSGSDEFLVWLAENERKIKYNNVNKYHTL
jgi:hypothetical protein